MVCSGAGVVAPPPAVVGSPPPVPPTMSLPVISGCSLQWYATCPEPSNLTLYESPGFNVPESNDPSSAVIVCAMLSSLLTHVTVVPGSTMI